MYKCFALAQESGVKWKYFPGSDLLSLARAFPPLLISSWSLLIVTYLHTVPTIIITLVDTLDCQVADERNSITSNSVLAE